MYVTNGVPPLDGYNVQCLAPRLALAAAVDLPNGVDRLLLPCEPDQRIVLARNVQNRFGFGMRRELGPSDRRTGRDRRKNIPRAAQRK